MRQAGSLAAAGLFALENQVARLQIDHDHAKVLEDLLSSCSFVKEILPVETNILIAECAADFDMQQFMVKMKEKGVLFFAIAPKKFRLVTHLDITPDMLSQFEKTLKQID